MRATKRILPLATACLFALICCASLAPGLAAEGEVPFTVVMLPDTQHYSRRYPELFMAQTEWIRDNRARENIVFVTHVGDIVNDRKKIPAQWAVAQRAMSVLDGVVPWGVAIGNHDFDTGACDPGEATEFRKAFGPERFRGRGWYGGASTNGLNSCQLFTAGGIDFVALHLELDVPDDAIEWAKGVLHRYPKRAAIVTTHSYLNSVTSADGYNGRVTDRGNSARQVWKKLIREEPQIFLVLCGHHQRTVAFHRVVRNKAGAQVVEMLADYQAGPHGGDAWLRLLRFVPKEASIQVRTYSPALKEFKTDPQNQFTVPFDLPACCRRKEAAGQS